MKQTNVFKLLSISIVTMLFSVNVWADAWSDRGYVQTNTTHRSFQITDAQSQAISRHITGTTFTFENWFYLDDMSQAKGRFLYNNGAQFGFNNAGTRLIIQNLGAGRTVDVALDYAILPDFSDLTAGRWIHIALVVDGNNWKVYLDGTVRYNANLAGGIINNTAAFHIAGDPWTPFSGKVAEFRVWDIARTGAEIAADMRKRLVSSTPNLIARINFGEGSGDKSMNYSSVGGNAWAAGGAATTITWGTVSKPPTNLQTPDINTDGFTLTWDGGSETEYKIALTNTVTANTTYYTTSNKSYTFTGLAANSSYDVEVMSSMPLESGYSSEIFVSLITSGINNQQAAGVKLNVSDSHWQIASEDGETICALVYSLSGSLVGKYSNQNQVRIDKSNFSKGVYIITVNTHEGKSVFKVVK